MSQSAPPVRRRKMPPKGRQPGSVQCPQCRQPLDPHRCQGLERPVRCGHCRTQVHVVLFPAFARGAETGGFGHPLRDPQEAACFFHPSKQAEKTCELCGRFICGMCDTAEGGAPVCATCFDREIAAGAYPRDVLNPGGLALVLAFLPLLLFPLTLMTAPMALYLAVAGWRKSGVLVGSSRGRLALAGVLALVQIVGWLIFFGAVLMEFWKENR